MSTLAFRPPGCSAGVSPVRNPEHRYAGGCGAPRLSARHIALPTDAGGAAALSASGGSCWEAVGPTTDGPSSSSTMITGLRLRSESDFTSCSEAAPAGRAPLRLAAGTLHGSVSL